MQAVCMALSHSLPKGPKVRVVPGQGHFEYGQHLHHVVHICVHPMPWILLPPYCLMLYVSQSNSCHGRSYLLIACMQPYARYPSAQRCTAGQHALEICNRPG